jgi:protein-tyrosine phosphatase
MSVVLTICTGNLCRSPSAELLLERDLTVSGIDGVTVHSAGTRGAKYGPPDRLVKEARNFGIDLAGHVPRKFDTSMIVEADVVIGMAREHVREVVVAEASAFAKTFTLREIVRRGQAQGPRPSDVELGAWLASIHVGRRYSDLIGDAAEDDIADPMGGSSDDYRRMLHDVAALTTSFRQLAWP